eukprot:scaffold309454_cov18-Tisochrysis_lutea.AAC.1
MWLSVAGRETAHICGGMGRAVARLPVAHLRVASSAYHHEDEVSACAPCEENLYLSKCCCIQA